MKKDNGNIVSTNLTHLAQYWKQICNHIDNKIDKDLKCKYKHKTWQDINITTIVFLYIRSFAKLVPHRYTQKICRVNRFYLDFLKHIPITLKILKHMSRTVIRWEQNFALLCLTFRRRSTIHLPHYRCNRYDRSYYKYEDD